MLETFFKIMRSIKLKPHAFGAMARLCDVKPECGWRIPIIAIVHSHVHFINCVAHPEITLLWEKWQ